MLDTNELPALHIVNYEKGGYVVIAGDKRVSLIQAYAENGSLTPDTEELQEGLIMWLSKITEVVIKTRNDIVYGNAPIVQKFEPSQTRALTNA
ncbi:Spi family protease inhibitor [Anditalea andensis]|uniref:Spi family protease inhibitor n=1 Tax=Anditalea andensis TaxID=1048983 RepID=UPI0021CDD73F|nr:Spi family protease inhibitor [Anditalea andensis]